MDSGGWDSSQFSTGPTAGLKTHSRESSDIRERVGFSGGIFFLKLGEIGGGERTTMDFIILTVSKNISFRKTKSGINT